MFHAPFDVRLARSISDAQITTVVQPDICVVGDPTKTDKRGCLGAPEFFIEIASPGNLKHNTKTKFGLYEEAGVLEYWMVFPGEKTVLAYQLDAPRPVATLPGLAIKWSEIFEERA